MILRNYATKQDIVGFVGGDETDYSDQVINQAEMLIDNLTADFLGDVLQKAYVGDILYTALEATLYHDRIEIPSINLKEGEYSKMNVEILEGNQEGKIFYIKNNFANIINIDTDLEETFTPLEVGIRIFQLGKYPMQKDVRDMETRLYKLIPREIKQAVAVQAKFIKDNPDLFTTVLLQSESIGQNYSYTAGRQGENIERLYAPGARQIVSALGFDIQTI